MIKSSNSTKTVLNSNTIAAPFTRLCRTRSFQFALLLTVVVFTLLVNLGLWQLRRGDEKQALEQQLAARESLPPVAISEVNRSDDNLTGLNVITRLSPAEQPLIYLDNQVYNGQVGYLVYQVMLTHDTQHALLVELGFVKAEASRSTLPPVPYRLASGQLQGRIYQRMTNPLSQALMAEQLDHVRIQNLNIDELSLFITRPLYPFVLQPGAERNWPLPQPWQPLPMPSAKHYGYAFQWFAMATVWLLIVTLLLLRQLRQQRSSL